MCKQCLPQQEIRSEKEKKQTTTIENKLESLHSHTLKKFEDYITESIEKREHKNVLHET